MYELIFNKTKPNGQKLINYGFKRVKNRYLYSTGILNGDFTLNVIILPDGNADTVLIDNDSGSEYVLYKTDAQGAYVGKVRAEIEKRLYDIAKKCCDKLIFKSSQTYALINYVHEKYGEELEFLWEKSPENAIWRRRDNKKWYGVVMNVCLNRLGINSDETVEILNLKSTPDNVQKLTDGKKYFPAWHMNKKHWYTVILNQSVPTEQILKEIDNSRKIVE